LNPTQILTTGLVVTIPASTAPGTYTGVVTFTLLFDSTAASAAFSYQYTVGTYLNVSLDQGLYFHATVPDVATPPESHTGYVHPYSTIGATANTKFHLAASLTPPVFQTSTIPTSQLWLSIDTSASLASSAADTAVLSNPGGCSSIRYPVSGSLGLGIYNFYLSGRIKTTAANPPGVYNGTLTVTITGE